MKMGSCAVQDQASMCAEGVVQNKGGMSECMHWTEDAYDN